MSSSSGSDSSSSDSESSGDEDEVQGQGGDTFGNPFAMGLEVCTCNLYIDSGSSIAIFHSQFVIKFIKICVCYYTKAFLSYSSL